MQVSPKMKVSLPTIVNNSKSPKATLLQSPKWQYAISRNYSVSVKSTLDKSIRSNNIYSLLGPSKLSSTQEDIQASDIEEEERQEIITNVNTIRKRINELAQQCNKKIRDTEKLKGDIERVMEKEDIIEEQTHEDLKNIEDMKAALTYQRVQTEEAEAHHASYIFMLERLKKDRLTDQMKIAKFDKLYEKKYNELSQKLRKVKNSKQFLQVTKNFVGEVAKQVTVEEEKRQRHLTEFEETLVAKEGHEVEREKRRKHFQDVAENAAQEGGHELKQYNELLLTHKFVKLFLKNKIDRQIAHYKIVEQAYQKIKAATGLHDLTEITAKFLNREEKYSELLISIAASEKKVGEAKKMNEQIKVKVKAIKDENSQLDKALEERNTNKELTPEAIRELNMKDSGFRRASLVVESAHKWGLRALLKVDKAQNNVKDNYNQLYPKERMVDLFKDLITSLKTNLDKLDEKKEEIEVDEKQNNEFGDKYKEYLAKNVRVRAQNEANRDLSRGESSRVMTANQEDEGNMDSPSSLRRRGF